MRRFVVSLLVLAVFASAGIAKAGTINLTFDNSSDALIGSGGWTEYGSVPAAFSIDSFAFAPNNVLHVVTRSVTILGGQTQAYSHGTNGSVSSIWFDFYVDPAAW